MLDEKEMELQARLLAIEHVLTHLATSIYMLHQVPDAVIQKTHQNIREGLAEETFQTAKAEPTLKDHFAALIAESADKILKKIERVLAEKRAPQAP